MILDPQTTRLRAQRGGFFLASLDRAERRSGLFRLVQLDVAGLGAVFLLFQALVIFLQPGDVVGGAAILADEIINVDRILLLSHDKIPLLLWTKPHM